jgi:hypothetical protein
VYKILHLPRNATVSVKQDFENKLSTIPKGYYLDSWQYLQISPTHKGSFLIVCKKVIEDANETNGRKFRQGEE